MSRPRLLIVPSFTELEWGIRPLLEEWADVASFDMPGIGETPPPGGIGIADPIRAPESLQAWRAAGVQRGLAEVDSRGWDEFVVAADSRGIPTAVRMVAERLAAVRGLALGHAVLSHATEGDRPPVRGEVWHVFGQLARQGSDAFVRHGIAQLTRGGIDDDVAQQMIERFPDMDLVADMVETLSREPEPMGDELAALDVPLLLAKHEGCLGQTDEGFEDIVAAFPRATTVICPEQCSSSPTFAEAIREFCDGVGTG
jgi:pimeloyl-ACP methyl ester carboxylesterase